MENTAKTYEHENVNGVMLSLKVNSKPGSPNLKQFTISYKNQNKKSSASKTSLIFAVLFNILGLYYVQISLTAISIIIIVFTFLAFFWITHTVQSESLLVIPTVGMQSSIKYVYGKEENFMSWSSIDDIIINEVIKANRVLYFLTLLVKNDGQQSQQLDNMKLVPLFKFTKPRLAMLETIYSELQVLLMESRKDAGDSTLASGDYEEHDMASGDKL